MAFETASPQVMARPAESQQVQVSLNEASFTAGRVARVTRDAWPPTQVNLLYLPLHTVHHLPDLFDSQSLCMHISQNS